MCDELKLLDQCKKGDLAAKDSFAKQNFGLVHMAARRFMGRGTDYDDLFQIGCIGLTKAIDRFDFERGVRFSTYAVPIIFGELKRHFRDCGEIKMSRSVRQNGAKLAATAARLRAETGREPAVSELCAESGLSEEDAALAIGACRMVLSLSAENAEGGALIDLVGVSEEEGLCEKISLREAISALPETERRVVIERYFKCRTQADCAERLKMSQVQVSRVEKRARERIKELLA